LLYGCETWTISETTKERLRAVLRAAGVQRTLMKTIRQRQLDFFGHVMRRQGMEALVVTGKSRRETSKRTTKTGVFGQSVYMFGG